MDVVMSGGLQGCHLVSDPSKAREKLGWRHTVSFEELAAEMVQADVKTVKMGPSGAIVRSEAGLAKSNTSIKSVLASAPNDDGAFWVDHQEAKATACRGLTIPAAAFPPSVSRWADPLGQRNSHRAATNGRDASAAGNGDIAPPHGEPSGSGVRRSMALTEAPISITVPISRSWSATRQSARTMDMA
jgi:hypothetical protein